MGEKAGAELTWRALLAVARDAAAAVRARDDADRQRITYQVGDMRDGNEVQWCGH